MDDALLPVYTCPIDQEMERTETSRHHTYETESLFNKLVAHYKTGMSKSKPRNFAPSMTPELAKRAAIPLCLFTVLSTLKIGLFDVLPLIYAEEDLTMQHFLIGFIFSELLINWLGIRYGDSSYSRYCGLNRKLNVFSKGKFVDSPKANRVPDKFVTVSLPMSAAITPEEVLNAEEMRMEADRTNHEIEKRNELMSSRTIDDLLFPSATEASNSASIQMTDSTELIDRGPSIGTSNVEFPTPTIKTDGKIVTKVYPYWSWAPCYDCGRTRPPRCHHCPLCKVCVLKRDHHCFLAGTCIGYRNHRFFVVFIFWALVGCTYSTLHGFCYVGAYLWYDMSFTDVLFPIAIARFFMGYLPFQVAISVTTLTFLIYFDVVAVTSLCAHSRLIRRGLTSFEKTCLKSSLEIKDTRKLSLKIRAVFGSYWSIGFLFPISFFQEPEEDPIHWPSISVLKH